MRDLGSKWLTIILVFLCSVHVVNTTARDCDGIVCPDLDDECDDSDDNSTTTCHRLQTKYRGCCTFWTSSISTPIQILPSSEPTSMMTIKTTKTVSLHPPSLGTSPQPVLSSGTTWLPITIIPDSGTVNLIPQTTVMSTIINTKGSWISIHINPRTTDSVQIPPLTRTSAPKPIPTNAPSTDKSYSLYTPSLPPLPSISHQSSQPITINFESLTTSTRGDLFSTTVWTPQLSSQDESRPMSTTLLSTKVQSSAVTTAALSTSSSRKSTKVKSKSRSSKRPRSSSMIPDWTMSSSFETSYEATTSSTTTASPFSLTTTKTTTSQAPTTTFHPTSPTLQPTPTTTTMTTTSLSPVKTTITKAKTSSTTTTTTTLVVSTTSIIKPSSSIKEQSSTILSSSRTTTTTISPSPTTTTTTLTTSSSILTSTKTTTTITTTTMVPSFSTSSIPTSTILESSSIPLAPTTTFLPSSSTISESEAKSTTTRLPPSSRTTQTWLRSPSITTPPVSTSLSPTIRSSITPATTSLVASSSVRQPDPPVFCNDEQTGEEAFKGVLFWDRTKAPTTVRKQCPFGPLAEMVIRKCIRVNRTTAKWLEINVENCNKRPFCSAGHTGTKYHKGILNWPATAVGITPSTVQCPFNLNSVASRQCLLNKSHFTVSWGDVSDGVCEILGLDGVTLDTLKKMQMSEDNELKVATLLNAVTSNLNATIEDVKNVADMFERVLVKPSNLAMISEELLGAISNIMNTNSSVLAQANEQSGATQEILTNLGVMMENINLDNTNSIRINTTNIVAEAIQLDNITEDTTFMSSLSPAQDDTASDVSITLPRSILKEGQRISFFNFLDDGLFPIAQGTSTKSFINSAIVAATIKDTDVKNVTDGEIVVEFEFIDASYANNCTCVYWDFEANAGLGNWARNVCVFEVIDASRGKCICDHLTHFGLIVDLFPDQPLPTIHDRILEKVTYIGCYLSIVGLFLTIVTLLSLKQFRSGTSGQILLNLCVALLLFLIIFVAGIERVESDSICTAIAALLHYFVLVAIIWMGAEGFHLFVSVVLDSLPGELGPSFVVKCALVAWVLPFIIVLLTVLVKKDDYTGNNYCRVGGTAFYIAFMVPALTIMLFNLIIFLIVVKTLLSTRFPDNRHSSRFAHFRRVLGVMTIFGITWIFGVLAVGDLRIAFQYLFCIFNSFQGFMIFIIYCMSDRKVRERLIRFLCVLPDPSSNRVIDSSTQRQSDIEIDMRTFEPRPGTSIAWPEAPGGLMPVIPEERIESWTGVNEFGEPYRYPPPPGSRPKPNIPLPVGPDEPFGDKLVSSTMMQQHQQQQQQQHTKMMQQQTKVMALEPGGNETTLRSADGSIVFINEGRVIQLSKERENRARGRVVERPNNNRESNKKSKRKSSQRSEPPKEDALKTSDDLRRWSEVGYLPRLKRYAENIPAEWKPDDELDNIDHANFQPGTPVYDVRERRPVAEDDVEYDYYDTYEDSEEIAEHFLAASTTATAGISGHTSSGYRQPSDYDSETSSIASVGKKTRISDLPSALPTPKTRSQATLSPGNGEERRMPHFEMV